MNVSAVTAIGLNEQQYERQATQELGFSSQDFMKLLIAQLQNQDPLAPMNSADFMAQLAQLQSVAKLNELAEGFDRFAQMVGLGLPASLVGRTVVWQDQEGMRQQGEVEAVRLQSGQRRPGQANELVVVVGGQEVGMDEIVEIW